MATCCNVMSKAMITLVSFLSWVVAAGFIFLSIWIFREFGIYGKLFDAKVLSLLPASILLVIGLVLFIMGLVGCIGAAKEQKCIIGLYFVLLLIIFIGLGAGAGLSYVYRQKIDDGLHGIMMDEFQKYGNKSSIDTVIDEMQSEMYCCGVNNYTDWLTLPWHKTHQDMDYPTSCCKNNSCDSLSVNAATVVNTTTKIYTTTAVNALYTQGCYVKIKDEIAGHMIALYSVIGATALILFIGMTCACMLLRDRRNRDFIYRDLGSDDGMHA